MTEHLQNDPLLAIFNDANNKEKKNSWQISLHFFCSILLIDTIYAVVVSAHKCVTACKKGLHVQFNSQYSVTACSLKFVSHWPIMYKLGLLWQYRTLKHIVLQCHLCDYI